MLTVTQFNSAGDGTANALALYAQTMVELDGVSISGAPSTLSTYTNYTLSDSGGNTTDMYTTGSDSAVSDAVDAANTANPGGFGGTYNIIGYADVYKGVAEIYPTAVIAVPEPASLSVLAIGAVGCLLRRRRS